MPPQYAKEQLLRVYKTLPEPLKEVLGSSETQDEIDTICRENQVTDDTIINSIYNLTMDVFMGLAAPEDFVQQLAQVLQNQPSTAREIAHRIQRFILFPLKAEIAQLHKIEGQTVTQKPAESYMLEAKEDIGQTASKPPSEEQRRQDAYRESIDEK